MFQLFDRIIGNIQHRAADGAGGQRDALIGDLVPPIVQRQYIVLGNLHNNRAPFILLW